MTRIDLDEVMAIEQASFTGPWLEEMFVAEMEGPLSRAIVLEDSEGWLVGFATYRVILDEAHLLNIAVDPDRRGHGLGRVLMHYIMEDTARKGAEYLFLEVRPSNLSAHSLYTSLGFVAVGRRKRYYTDNGEDALVMELRMPPVEGT